MEAHPLLHVQTGPTTIYAAAASDARRFAPFLAFTSAPLEAGRWIHERNVVSAWTLRLRGDSLFVADVLRCRKSIKDGQLKRLVEDCFKSLRILREDTGVQPSEHGCPYQVPRAFNNTADLLAGQASASEQTRLWINASYLRSLVPRLQADTDACFDGSSVPNPGPSGAGFHLSVTQASTAYELMAASVFLGGGTSSAAEFQACSSCVALC